MDEAETKTSTYKYIPVTKPKYSKRCKTCQMMAKHASFRRRILNSTYFYPDSHESIGDIIEDYPGCPAQPQVYNHMKYHKFAFPESRKLKVAEKRLENETKVEAQAIVQQALEGEVVSNLTDKAQHVQALDAIISQGREEILKGKVKLRTSDILAAIKIKADIEKGSKDRTADLVKTLAGLAAPK